MRFIPTCVFSVVFYLLLAPCVVIWAAGTDPEKLPGVVVDDTAAEITGDWSLSSRIPPFIGEGYRFTDNAKGGKATFRLRVQESGSYYVLIAFTSSGNRSDSVPVVVHTANGKETVTVNQKSKPQFQNGFEPLGEFTFEAGDVLVEFDASLANSGAVIIDAVQILTDAELAEVKKNQPAPQPPLLVTNAPAKPTPAKTNEKPKEVEVVELAPLFQRVPAKQPKALLTSERLDVLLELTAADSDTELCDDVSFLRRVTLDLIGRQPKPEELTSFAADNTPTKRTAVVDRLLASPEFGVNWANYWSDVISYRTPQPELTFLNYMPFKAWLASEFNSGKKWDEITYQIVTAGGKVGENPAATFVGFHQADKSRLASETTRVFLSTQIQCAECHHHKFIDLKQETFHHVAAYFARVEAKLPHNDSQAILVKSKTQGEHKMPGGKDEMTPGAFGGGGVNLGASDIARRMELAEWLVGAENPWFAKAFVNRVWARMMGRGFSEPVDEIGELGDHVLPEVFSQIADHFIASEFDSKPLFRLIVLSRAYQRPLAAAPKGWVKPFSIVSPGRLRGDEVFESLTVGLELPNITPPAMKPTGEIRFPPPPKSTRDLVNDAFGFDPSLAAEHVTRTMQQVMFMMNNRQLQQQVNAGTESGTVLAKLLEETQDDNVVLAKLYTRLLSRQPSEKEIEIARTHLANVKERRAAFEDLLWSLLNSAEFTSRR